MSAKTLHVLILSLVLAAVGLGIFIYRAYVLEFPLSANQEYRGWTIEATFTFNTAGKSRQKPILFELQLPHGNSTYAVAEDHFVSKGYGKVIETDSDTGNRIAKLTKRTRDWDEVVVYRAAIYELQHASEEVVRYGRSRPRADWTYAPENRHLLDRPKEDPLYVAIDAVLKEARRLSANDQTLARELFRLVQQKGSAVDVIVEELEPVQDKIDAAALLANTTGIPARVVNGLELVEKARNAKMVKWLEVFVGGRWVAVDPEKGVIGLQKPYLSWWIGNEPWFENKGRLDYSISVQQSSNDALTRALWKSEAVSNVLLRFSLFNLPLDMQMIFRLILLIPVGGLVIAVLKQMIGLKTFGTFMPVLIALSFVETGLLSGIIFYVVIVGLGLLLRSYFTTLQLMLVPRLASVLTIVILLLVLMALVTHNMGFYFGSSYALFPIVILTMTIERMALIWDEEGGKAAMKIGSTSLLAAVIAYFFISIDGVRHIVFTFPELLLLLLALTLMIGRYNGYRLTEYYRFRALSKAIAEDQVGKQGS